MAATMSAAARIHGIWKDRRYAAGKANTGSVPETNAQVLTILFNQAFRTPLPWLEDQSCFHSIPLDCSNYRLARAYERTGSAPDAIKAYEASLNDPSIDTPELRNFVSSQVQRVKEKGPQYASPIPGLIYQLM